MQRITTTKIVNESGRPVTKRQAEVAIRDLAFQSILEAYERGDSEVTISLEPPVDGEEGVTLSELLDVYGPPTA